MQTLAEHLSTQQIPNSLCAVITIMANSCVKISALVERGALAGVLGSSENENIQGETQKKLDIIANDLLKADFALCPNVAAIASEEEDVSLGLHEDGQFLVAFDPLDGSSNIDVNGQIGSIFSILPKMESFTAADQQQFLHPGKKQVAAAYAIYGASTQLVISLGKGTHLFTLDPEKKEFFLTQPNLKIPADTQEFSINMSNQRFWFAPIKHYIQALLEGETGKREKRFNMRWNASMVGDVHRVLLRGGIFLYPSDSRDAKQPAKLRLLYEANPMAFLVKNAGGKAWSESHDILEIIPDKLHQRVPVILGSNNEVDICTSHFNQ